MVEQERCRRCDSKWHPGRGCAECHIFDNGGQMLFYKADDESIRRHSSGFGGLSVQQQWDIVDSLAEDGDRRHER